MREDYLPRAIRADYFRKGVFKLRFCISQISTFFSLALFAVVTMNCADKTNPFDDQTGQERCQRLSAEERELLIPNEVFQRVCDVQTDQLVSQLETDMRLLNETNGEGDTPLGFAIKLREFDLAETLLTKMTIDQFTHVNSAGESYIFLAAKFGSVHLIERIATGFFEGRANDYDRLGWFQLLDQPNLLGQRALHVAADRQVAVALRTQYRRGTLAFEWLRFTLNRDVEGNTFLHSAARDGRFDVLAWGSEVFCRKSDTNEESEFEWLIPRLAEDLYQWAGSALLGALRFIQTFGVDTYDWVGVDTPWMLMVNARNQTGETPLHLALRERDLMSVQALLSCKYLDFFLPDEGGKLPLHQYLSGLDQHQQSFSQNEKSIFEAVVARETKMRMWPVLPVQRSSYLNFQDNHGESSMHAAARLRDPFFYDRLSELGGDPWQRSNANLRPVDIFNRQQTLRRQNPK